MNKQLFLPIGAATQVSPPPRSHSIPHPLRRRICAPLLLAPLLLAVSSAVQAEDFNYTTNNGAITITGYNGCDGAVTIPSTINGLPVISIGDQAFYGATSLTNITIPSGVTSIGRWAFWSCTSLTSVAIPNSVTNIWDWAFWACSSLTNVTLGTSLSGIGSGAFQSCSSLISITIPNGVTTVGDWAFANCASLTSVNIGNGLSSVGNHAFFSCTSLTRVALPGSVTSIGDLAFYNCTSLTGAYFQGNAPSIGSPLFNAGDKTIVYYLPGTAGWGPTFGGRPTALWSLPNPLILNNGPDFGVQTNRFGFTISWATNIPVVVEACTNLATSPWSPVATNTLSAGSSYFSDPRWTNFPRRFYRLRGP